MAAQLPLLPPAAGSSRRACADRHLRPDQAACLVRHVGRVLRRLEAAPATQARVQGWAQALLADGRWRPCPHPLRRGSRYDLQDLQLELDLWRDEDLVELHERLLLSSLRLLGDSRATPAHRAEVWAWVEDPPTDPPRMCSFELCCQVLGLDPDILQAHLLDLARRGRLRGPVPR